MLPSWISNCICYKVCDEITNPFPNFNCAVWNQISNFIPHFTGCVITSTWWNLKYSLLIKPGPAIEELLCVWERYKLWAYTHGNCMWAVFDFYAGPRPEASNFTVGPATSKVCRPCGQATFIPAMWSRMVYHCQWTLTQQDFIQKIYI